MGQPQKFIQVNGLRLHYVEAGSGPLVLLLHGFPEFWYSWRHQIKALSEAGFRAAAPDMRGFNLSEKPPRVADYQAEQLTDDAAALIEGLGGGPAVLAGHDWGGAVAWATAMRHPAKVRKLIICNAPHPEAFYRDLLRRPSQMLRSSYMLFFQIPGLSEAVLSAFDFALLRWAFRNDPRRPDVFAPHEVERYLEALRRPGALRSGLNYYRALFRRRPSRQRRMFGRIACPTLLIWGERDRYLGASLTKGLEEWVSDLRIERLPGCSHWVQLEEADKVSQLMLDFLGSPEYGREQCG